jgi:ATP-dependent DNA ligase
MVQRVARNPKPRPRFIEPMERQRVARLPERDEWLYEPKQDGYGLGFSAIEGSGLYARLLL